MRRKQLVLQQTICSVFLLTCLLSGRSLLAQEGDQDFWFLNPGIRVGYTFGSGLTIGFEVSIGVYNGGFVGASAGIDYTMGDDLDSNIFRAYLDAEAGLLLVGLGFGGVLVWHDGRMDLGRQTTLFAAWPVGWSDADPISIK